MFIKFHSVLQTGSEGIAAQSVKQCFEQISLR